LSRTKILNVGSCSEVDRRLTPILIAVDDESLYLFGKHRQSFIFRTSSVGEVNMLWVYHYS
jgi:hypothetical protein